MCGEKAVGLDHQVDILGSPPRMRGKDDHPLNPLAGHGITPACAGKSDPGKRRTSGSGDHPRVCGEKERVNRCACWSEGSPPRMRGKVDALSDIIQDYGITPAYAGKSTMCAAAWPRLRDHPRMCGEKFLTRASRRGKKGSPPRMRGKAVAHRDDAGDDGITPACAGKSPA